MKYQSELIKDILEERGHEKSSLHYESECIETWIEENKGAYPKLCDYQGEWLNYIVESPLGVFPYETITDVTEATVNNVVPFAFKSATLKGSTKYRDIDTGDILDTFDETKNLELVSVKVPVLTTTNEDGTKTNILTVNEEVELRGIGNAQDEMDCLTGELKENFVAISYDGSENWREESTPNNIRLAYILPSIREKAGGKVICDKLPTVSDNKSVGIRLSANGGLYVQIDASLGNSVKEWLKSNKINIVYEKNDDLKVIKTVELTVINQDGETLSKFTPIEGTMNIATNGTPIKPTVSLEIPVEATNQNLMTFIEEENK